MGSKRSGHWRHRGRPGKRGGSASSKGSARISLSLHKLSDKITYLAYKGEKPPQGKNFLVPGGEAYTRWMYDPKTGKIIFNVTQPGEMPVWHANMLADMEGTLGAKLPGFDTWVRGTISGNELGFLGAAAGIGTVEVDVVKSMRNIQHAVRHAHSVGGVPNDFTVVITFGAGKKAARMKVGEL